MFTTGSKLFLGATVLAVVAAIVYGLSNGRIVGLARRDRPAQRGAGLRLPASASTTTPTTATCRRCPRTPRSSAPAAQPPVGRSMWPVVAAVAVGAIAVGAQSKPIVFKAGVVLLLAAAVEWMVQGLERTGLRRPRLQRRPAQADAPPARVPAARRSRPRRSHLLVLADHAVDRQERRSGRVHHRRCPRAVRRIPVRRQAEPQEGCHHRRVRDRRPRRRSAPAP